MIRIINFKKVTLLPALLPFGLGSADVVLKDTKTAKEADFSVFQTETGWDRLRQMFRKDDFGKISHEVNTILQVSFMSSFAGAMYGGLVASREAYIAFMKNNQATAFTDHLEAKRKLQDAVSISFAKGAVKWGWRLTYFCTSYITVSTTIAAYRGKNGIIEHTLAGLVAGTLYRFKMGPHAWVATGGAGLVIGSLAGLCTSTLLKLTGMTMEEVRYWNYKWTQARTDSFNLGLKKHREKEELQILLERDTRVRNTSLDDLDKNINVNNSQ